jgi:dienelactone hydrolase
MRRLFLACAGALSLSVAAGTQTPPKNHSIDPEHLVVTEPVANPLTVITEPVKGSSVPVHLMYVETVDGLYAPLALRRPSGDGPFPIVLFAHMNGGMGIRWVREWTQYGSGTLEQFLRAGYAVAWMRYRAEVDRGYTKGGPLTEGTREGRQLFNHGPLEVNDIISIIKFVKTLPYIDPDRVGYVGLSHGGEALMMLSSQYDGLRAAIASEPASIEFLARQPRPRPQGAAPEPETAASVTPEIQQRDAQEMRKRIDVSVAMQRIRTIKTPIFVQGRDRDHNQAIFRVNYELLREAGKDVEWKSYDHDEHGFIFVRRNAGGSYEPDAIQVQAIKDSIAYFDRKMAKRPQSNSEAQR